jgi:hypothetical protein
MPIINRETILGWNYSITNDEQGIMIPCEKPRYENNINEIIKIIDKDITFQTLREYRIKYKRYWFIKVNDQWKRLSDTSDSPMALLFKDKYQVEVMLNE